MTTGPLSGVKVLEIAGIGPGPFCGMLLADLGADVVRVDRPGGRGMQLVPWADDLLNRGKRSIAVDLAKPGGVETVLSLVEHAEILFEGFRPGGRTSRDRTRTMPAAPTRIDLRTHDRMGSGGSDRAYRWP